MIDPSNSVRADCVTSRLYDDGLGGGRPSVLYITNKFRRLPDSGGATREFELLRRLIDRFDVHYVAFTERFDEERTFLDAPALDFRSVTLVRAENLVPDGTPARIRVHASRYGQQIVEELVRNHAPGLVHVVGYFLMGHLSDSVALPIVLQEENIEFQLADDARPVAGAPIGEDNGEALERAAWRRAALCLTVAEEDSDIVRGEVSDERVVCIPNGVCRRARQLDNCPTPSPAPRLLFVGNYSWAPSRDAVLYLIECLWAQIRQRCPDAGLSLAGSGMEPELRRKAEALPGVSVTGPYTDYEDLTRDCPIIISPLRFGGGNKMKMAEALSVGLPVIATSLSLRGYPPSVRDAVAIADDAGSFASVVAELLGRPALRSDMMQKVRTAALELPTWDALADRQARVWSNVMKRSSPIAARSISGGRNP